MSCSGRLLGAGSVVGVRFAKVAETFLVTCGCFDPMFIFKVASSITLDLFVNFRY